MRQVFSKFLKAKNALSAFVRLFIAFIAFLYGYGRHHAIALVVFFEGIKDILVHFFQMKRGRYTRPFLHFATILVIGLGVMVTPLLADTFPLFANQAQGLEQT